MAEVSDGEHVTKISVQIVPLSESQIIPLQMNNVGFFCIFTVFLTDGIFIARQSPLQGTYKYSVFQGIS